ncbi:unnamed protein product [Medioppia subpectinata]|uniref:Inositol polyphosphate-related phosphatase domain-containing protein n=1 Tax=Medioppia subpectinata TaxID=1979941 RepID=A0A7R9KG20_9ACAR|nr:unnamed protein product [Medioppia subpectinata]CAG2102685.1 unnamed protein product [Medioppia subpectinata]
MSCVSANQSVVTKGLSEAIGRCAHNTIADNYNRRRNNPFTTFYSRYSVRTITWNLQSGQCRSDLRPLLGIDGLHTDTTAAGDQPLADVYAIGLQELCARELSDQFVDSWTPEFDRLFTGLDYVRLKRHRFADASLVVYTRRQLLPHFRAVEAHSRRSESPPNKAVAIGLTVDGVSVCIVNTHLTPHEQNTEKRVDNYNEIIADLCFTGRKSADILSHDYVLWMGDLNFRIDELTGDEIHDISVKTSSGTVNRFAPLLAKDQLNRVRLEGRAFSEFSESEPTFAPTYKFFIDTSDYDYKDPVRPRKPAFTDRILYRFTANAYENTTLDLQQLNYTSHPQYKQSDHKPVSALFHLKTRPFVSGQTYVTFAPIANWRVNRDFTAWFTITPADDSAIDTLSASDFIGLYKSDFISIDDRLLYVGANPVPTRWSPPGQSGDHSDNNNGQSVDTRTAANSEPWFLVHFSEQTLSTADRFRLVYVTQTGDVLGVSDQFVVTH